MRLVCLFAVLLLAGVVSAQCPQASAPQVHVSVMYSSPPPAAPVTEMVPVWIVPSQKAYQLYLPAAPTACAPAPQPAGRVEYHYGPFGGLRRVVVRP